MSYITTKNIESMSGTVGVLCLRMRDSNPGTWLCKICVPAMFCGRQYEHLGVQCRAVVDDFGNLVPVTEWQ